MVCRKLFENMLTGSFTNIYANSILALMYAVVSYWKLGGSSICIPGLLHYHSVAAATPYHSKTATLHDSKSGPCILSSHWSNTWSALETGLLSSLHKSDEHTIDTKSITVSSSAPCQQSILHMFKDIYHIVLTERTDCLAETCPHYKASRFILFNKWNLISKCTFPITTINLPAIIQPHSWSSVSMEC